MTIKDSIASGISQTKDSVTQTVEQVRGEVDKAFTEQPPMANNNVHAHRDLDQLDDTRPPSSPVEHKPTTHVLGGMTPPHTTNPVRERRQSITAVHGGSLNR